MAEEKKEVLKSVNGELKKFSEMTPDEIRKNFIGYVEYEKITNKKGVTYFIAKLNLAKGLTIKIKDFSETLFNLAQIGMGYKENVELIKAQCYCRFYKGESINSRKEVYTYHRVEVLVSRDPVYIAHNVFLSSSELQLLNFLDSKDRLLIKDSKTNEVKKQSVKWVEVNLQENVADLLEDNL